MAEYIDRENYCKNQCRCANEYCDKESCPIWKAPTVDVVVVTRCKDCKYVRPEVNGHTGEQVGVWCYLWDEISIGADDFLQLR